METLHNIVVGVVEDRVPAGDVRSHVEGEGGSDAETLVLVDPQAVLLHCQVTLQVLFNRHQLGFCFQGLGNYYYY